MVGTVFNSCLDSFVRPHFHLFGRSWSAFNVCGYAGLAVGVALVMVLAEYQGLSNWVMGAVVVIDVLTFLGLAMATKIVTGEERLIFFHHWIAILASTAGLLWVLGESILPYLEVAILGCGLVQACGRVGCLMAGCCHGVPHRWGVCYGERHAATGFTRHYVGIRLFPVQAFEAVWLFFLVVAGTIVVLIGQRPGTVAVSYAVAYVMGRFVLEFKRGDPARRYMLGFSEAQWTSVLLGMTILWLGTTGWTLLQSWHLVGVFALLGAVAAIMISRRFSRSAAHRLLSPHHIKEIAEGLRCTTPEGDGFRGGASIRIVDTSEGVRLSSSLIREEGSGIQHYALSSRHGGLSGAMADVLSGIIVKLRHPTDTRELIAGNDGGFHLLLRAPGARSDAR